MVKLCSQNVRINTTIKNRNKAITDEKVNEFLPTRFIRRGNDMTVIMGTEPMTLRRG